jgi:hypothetical protein
MSAAAPSLLTDYHVMFYLSEMLQPPTGAFEINVQLQG